MSFDFSMTDAEGQNTNFTMYSEASKQNFNAIPLFNYIEDIIETNTGMLLKVRGNVPYFSLITYFRDSLV